MEKQHHKVLERLEGKIDHLMEKLQCKHTYDCKEIEKNEAELKKRMELAKKNSRDLTLVKEARDFYESRRKKIPDNGLVLYIKDRKAYWVLI